MLGARTNNRSSSSASSPCSVSSCPFTATQWQELEHQALIYKYMVSGLPIPPQLLVGSVGWGCFQVGFGRKGGGVGDPEPGRCRRTDGKKWRCSKEAHPDSKYCERHMHRGKSNLSRKPVEISSSQNLIPSPNINKSSSSSDHHHHQRPVISSSSSSPSWSPSLGSETTHHNQQTLFVNPFTCEFSPQSSTTTSYPFIDSAPPLSSHPAFDKDHRRYIRCGKEDNLQLSSSSSKGYCGGSELDAFNYYPSKQANTYQHQQSQQQHCSVLGDDFKPSSSSSMRAIKLESSACIKYNNHHQEISSSSSTHHETNKPLHHFFGIGGGTTSTDSWLDLASTSRPS